MTRREVRMPLPLKHRATTKRPLLTSRPTGSVGQPSPHLMEQCLSVLVCLLPCIGGSFLSLALRPWHMSRRIRVNAQGMEGGVRPLSASGQTGTWAWNRSLLLTGCEKASKSQTRSRPQWFHLEDGND